MQKPAGLRAIELTALRNGIHVISEAIPGVRSIAIGVWIDAGSRTEAAHESGISHFIEHMLFKGTHTRSAEQIAREADAVGGHLDAFTGKEMVGFNTKVLAEHLDRGFDILADLVLHPRFAAEDVEKEKGVVLEELKMDRDDPEAQVHDLFMATLYPRHALGRPIIGTPKSIRSFDAAALRARHQHVYQPPYVSITAAGALDHGSIVRLAERYFGDLPVSIAPVRDPQPAPHAETRLRSKRSLAQIQVCVGLPAYPAASPKRFASYILNLILGGGMSSRLFQDVRERQGLAYSIYSELSPFRDTGCLAVYAGTSGESLAPLLRSVSAGFRDLKDQLVGEDELRRAKDHLKGSTILSLESTSSRMHNLARQFLSFGRFYTMDELMESIEVVTAQEVRDAALELFLPEKIAVTALGRLDGVTGEMVAVAC